jgi:hypothetical protein
MSDNVEQVRERHGLFKNVPRFLRRAVERRLAAIEDDPALFDATALVHFARIKRLHALLHIKPGDLARAMFFGKAPAGSARAALRELVAARNSPHAASEIIRRHRIPYLLAEAALGTIAPRVATALVETMEPDELIGRLSLLARRGLLEGDVRDAVLRRLSTMTQRFPYARIESVVRHANLDRSLASALFQLVESGAEQEKLQGETALLVDVSASMPREAGVLELAAAVAWRIDRALEPATKLHVCLAGAEATLASGIRRGMGLDQWRRVFAIAKPETPGTSIGAGVEYLAQQRLGVSRLVILTDGYENRPPRLVTAYDRYRSLTGQRPSIHLVQPAGASRQLGVDLKNAQVPFGVFSVDPHYLGLDALVAGLRGQSGETRLAQILAFE